MSKLTEQRIGQLEHLFLELSNERGFYDDFIRLTKANGPKLEKLTIPKVRSLIERHSSHSNYLEAEDAAFMLMMLIEHYDLEIQDLVVERYGPKAAEVLRLRYWNALCHAASLRGRALAYGGTEGHSITLYDSLQGVKQLFNMTFKVEHNPANQSNEKTIKEPTMGTIKTDSSIPVQTKTLVFGEDVQEMSKESLLQALRKLEAQKKEFKEYKTESKYIKAQIKSIEESIQKVVQLLDAD